MLRIRSLTALAVVLLVTSVSAQTTKGTPKTQPKTDTVVAPTLSSTQGAVGKADKDSLTMKPRGVDGRFEKDLVLQVTGTSKVTVLTMQTRAGKLVPVQQDADVKDLKPQQSIAVLYTQTATGPVLLCAVVLPVADK